MIVSTKTSYTFKEANAITRRALAKKRRFLIWKKKQTKQEKSNVQ